DQLEGRGMLDAGELDQRHRPYDPHRERERRRVRNDGVAILFERHRSQRNRRGKDDRGRDAARDEAEGGMKGTPEEIVFAAGTRKHRAKFAVGEHTAQRDDAADDPEYEDRKARWDILDLRSEE